MKHARQSKMAQDSSTAVNKEKQLERDTVKAQIKEQEAPTQDLSTTEEKQLADETPVERQDKSEALQSETQNSPRTGSTVKAQTNGNDRVRLLLEVAQKKEKQDNSASEQVEDHRKLHFLLEAHLSLARDHVLAASCGEADASKSKSDASLLKSRQRKTVYGFVTPSGSLGSVRCYEYYYF